MEPLRSKTPANDCEAVFDEFVAWFGGEIVANLFDQTHKLPNNADYLLFDRGVVAELKCLQKEYFKDKAVAEKSEKLINIWLRKGQIPKSNIKGNIVTIPDNLAPKIVDVFVPPLKNAVETANKQIKITKQHFNIPAAKGLLIMVNEQNSSLTPQMALHMLGRLFKHRYSSINSYIYLVPSMLVASSEMPEPANFSASGATRGDSIRVSPDQLKSVRERWICFLEEKSGHKIRVAVQDDHSALSDLGFFRK